MPPLSFSYFQLTSRSESEDPHPLENAPLDKEVKPREEVTSPPVDTIRDKPTDTDTVKGNK